MTAKWKKVAAVLLLSTLLLFLFISSASANYVTGDAGASWYYLSRVSTLTGQSYFGAESFVGTIRVMYWTVQYSDGSTGSGINFPWSTLWKGTHVHRFSSSGWKYGVLSGYGYAGGSIVYLLHPFDYEYIY